MTEEKRKEQTDKLKQAAIPLLKLLSEEYHPHCKVILTSTSVEIVEGLINIPDIHEYLID